VVQACSCHASLRRRRLRVRLGVFIVTPSSEEPFASGDGLALSGTRRLRNGLGIEAIQSGDDLPLADAIAFADEDGAQHAVNAGGNRRGRLAALDTTRGG
jgi:hypothetical protein